MLYHKNIIQIYHNHQPTNKYYKALQQQPPHLPIQQVQWPNFPAHQQLSLNQMIQQWSPQQEQQQQQQQQQPQLDLPDFNCFCFDNDNQTIYEYIPEDFNDYNINYFNDLNSMNDNLLDFDESQTMDYEID